MGLSAKVGSFNTTTGTSNVVVTGLGFQPKAVIFWWSGRTETTDVQGEQTHQRGVGFVAGTSQRWAIGQRSTHAGTTSDTQHYQSDAGCVVQVTAAAALDGSLDLASFDSDGFTLAVDDAFSDSLRVHYLALGGSDVTDAYVGTFQIPTATGAQAITAPGFQPDGVLFLASSNSATPPGADQGTVFSLGAADSAGASAVLFGVALNGQGNMLTFGHCRAGNPIVSTWGTDSIDRRSTFTSMDTNGFTLNWAEVNAGGGPFVGYLALKGCRVVVGDILTSTSDGATVAETGVGFQPKAALFASACRAASASDTTTAHDETSIGAAADDGSGIDQAAIGVMDKDAGGNADIGVAQSHAAVYLNQSTAATVALEGRMKLDSFDVDGFTCSMTDGTTADGDPAQSFVWYMAFGPAAGAPPTVNRRRRVIMCAGGR